MACDTAFRIVARRSLGEMTANHAATCTGEPAALHEMRIAVTRLRAAISFFSPMVADASQTRIRKELKWLNRRLGAVRDLDVAIGRLRAANKQPPSFYRPWDQKRANDSRALARALRSVKYCRLIKSTTDWIESGPWSAQNGKQAARKRAMPIAAYGPRKLTRLQKTLLKKGRSLRKMDALERHRLRLLNKQVCYSIEAFKDLTANKEFSGQQVALKLLRKAQEALGQLNDERNGRALAVALGPGGAEMPLLFYSGKREKRLIRTTAAAYRKLAALV